MALLTKDQILAAPDRRTEVVAVPEWGGEVMLAEMDGVARERYEDVAMKAQAATAPAGRSLRAELVALCAVQPETLAPLFSGATEVEALAKRSAKALDRLFKVATRMNVLSADAAEEQSGN